MKIRNIFILTGSYIFYGWWDYRFLLLLLNSTTLDYYLSNRMQNPNANRKAMLILSIVFNLGTLGFFKYFNFFTESATDLLNTIGFSNTQQTLNIILPIGISFYTFQTLGYTIDVYKKRIKPESCFWTFAAFISFFPQMIAGPIERAKTFLTQFHKRKVWDNTIALNGTRLILWGFFKKAAIADNLGILVDLLIHPDVAFEGFSVVLATLLFSVQIYTDFSGYCDMAIGIAMLLGYKLTLNFNAPYLSQSFNEFWSRWHITLSNWFRDYVYIPLGGNRKGPFKTYLFILITFILSGLWHGAQYTFLIWGLLHGLALIIEKMLKPKKSNMYSFITLLIVVALWLPFRAENILHLGKMIEQVFTFSPEYFSHAMQVLQGTHPIKLVLLGVGLVSLFAIDIRIKHSDFSAWTTSLSKSKQLGLTYLFIVFIALLINLHLEPNYIYFQF